MVKVYFYFPYQEECGVPVLFLRMSRWLAEQHGKEYEVILVDYEGGAMARNLKKNDTVQLCTTSESEGIFIDNGDILIMQSMNPSYFPNELHLAPKARLIFWTLHFRNLTPSLLPIPGLRDFPFKYLWLYKFCSIFYSSLLGRLCSFVNNMTQHKALYYMDWGTEEQTRKHINVKQSEDLSYLPVPASDYNGILKKTINNKDIFNICWLGRISYEKTPILVHTLKRCSEYAKISKKKMFFYIKGSGEFEDLVNNLKLDNEYFSKTKCTPIKFSDLDDFLLNNVDIMFAMGTSALESAKLGIPTVLVDYTSTNSPISGDYKFSFIYNRKGYDLGHQIKKDDIENNNDSLNFIFNELFNNAETVGARCRKYFVEKHSLSSVGDKFYDILRTANFTFDMIDPKVIKPPLLLALYNKIRRLKVN